MKAPVATTGTEKLPPTENVYAGFELKILVPVWLYAPVIVKFPLWVMVPVYPLVIVNDVIVKLVSIVAFLLGTRRLLRGLFRQR